MSKQPPKIITPKDRLYIQDILGMAKVNVKKANDYLNSVTDVEVSKEIASFCETLLSHYEDLFSLLQEEVGNG